MVRTNIACHEISRGFVPARSRTTCRESGAYQVRGRRAPLHFRLPSVVVVVQPFHLLCIFQFHHGGKGDFGAEGENRRAG